MIVWVNDFFIEDIERLGLTHDHELEELLRCCPEDHKKILSENVTPATLREHKDAHWIIGTSHNLRANLWARNRGGAVKYSTVEHDDQRRRRGSRFLWGNAHAIFFHTAAQRDRHVALFPKLAKKTKVSGAIYAPATLDLIAELHQSRKPRDVWAIFNGGPHKNPEAAIARCLETGRKYELIGGGGRFGAPLPHAEFLRLLSTCRGLVFHPACYESESRLTVEAKLMGLEIDINDKVPVKQEPWFAGSHEDVMRELRGRANRFWEQV